MKRKLDMNPEHILTETVQLWKNGIMITAQLSKEKAKEMVRQRKAFVISSQAISLLGDDRNGA